MEGAYFTDDKFSCHISFFVYTFCRLLDLSQNLNMTFQDFKYTRSNKNYSSMAYFAKYQRTSVTIEISAKCS